MKRDEVWRISFEPSVYGETKKGLPAAIVAPALPNSYSTASKSSH